MPKKPQTPTLDRPAMLTNLVSRTRKPNAKQFLLPDGSLMTTVHRMRWAEEPDSGFITQACAPETIPYAVIDGSLIATDAPEAPAVDCGNCTKFIEQAQTRGLSPAVLDPADLDVEFMIRTLDDIKTESDKRVQAEPSPYEAPDHPSNLLTNLVADTKSERGGVTSRRTHRLRRLDSKNSTVLTQACAPDGRAFNVVPGSLTEIGTPGTCEVNCKRCLQFIDIAQTRGVNMHQMFHVGDLDTAFTIATPTQARARGKQQEQVMPNLEPSTTDAPITTISMQELRRDFQLVAKSVSHEQYLDATEYAWSQVRGRAIKMANDHAPAAILHLLRQPSSINVTLTKSPANHALSEAKKKASEGKVHLTRLNPHSDLGFNQMCQSLNSRSTYRIATTSEDDASMAATCKVCLKMHAILVAGLEHITELLQIDPETLVNVTTGPRLKAGAIGARLDEDVASKLLAMAGGEDSPKKTTVAAEVIEGATDDEPVIVENTNEGTIDVVHPDGSMVTGVVAMPVAELDESRTADTLSAEIDRVRACTPSNDRPTSFATEGWLLGALNVARDVDGIANRLRYRAMLRIWADDARFREEVKRVAMSLDATSTEDSQKLSFHDAIAREITVTQDDPSVIASTERVQQMLDDIDAEMNEQITTPVAERLVGQVRQEHVEQAIKLMGLNPNVVYEHVTITHENVTMLDAGGQGASVLKIIPKIEDGIYELKFTFNGEEFTELVRAEGGVYHSNFIRPDTVPEDLVSTRIV